MQSRLILLLLTITLGGCAAKKINYIPSSAEYYGINFIRYSNEGFFITPEKPSGNYIPVGLIAVTLNQGGRAFEQDLGVNEAGASIVNRYWEKDTINIQMAIDSLVSISKGLNANSITNFNYSLESKTVITDVDERIQLSSISVSGFAIIRED